MQSGEPYFDVSAYPVSGWVHCGQVGSFGAYLISGTSLQLQSLATLPEVYPIVVIQKDDPAASLDTAITTARRNKINVLLTSKGLPTIPAGTTCRAAIRAVFKRFHDIVPGDDWDVDWPLHMIKDTAD